MYKIKIQSSLLATVKLAASCFHWQWTSLGVIRGSHPARTFPKTFRLYVTSSRPAPPRATTTPACQLHETCGISSQPMKTVSQR